VNHEFLHVDAGAFVAFREFRQLALGGIL
jgi:hypothetical protein